MMKMQKQQMSPISELEENESHTDQRKLGHLHPIQSGLVLVVSQQAHRGHELSLSTNLSYRDGNSNIKEWQRHMVEEEWYVV